METIRSLQNIEFRTLYRGFNQAFKDYELQLNITELQTMLHRRGFEPKLSFGAFHNKELIAFTFNGIGNYNGTKTAYDTGTGTIKEYRGRGLATNIFTHSIPHLKNAGISQYLLEVLQHNTSAISIYKKSGFEICRNFNYFSIDKTKINFSNKTADSIDEIKNISLHEKKIMSSFWDFHPSWQNSFEAIEREPEDYIFRGAIKNQSLIGYIIFEPVSGDITQIAVDKNHRRQGVATGLLHEICKLNQHKNIKALNTDVNCTGITGFFKSHGIHAIGKQHEMIRQL